MTATTKEQREELEDKWLLAEINKTEVWRSRAEAAEAKLKIAVEALEDADRRLSSLNYGTSSPVRQGINNALAKIKEADNG